MHLHVDTARQAFLAGCFTLALTSRAEAEDFFKSWSSSDHFTLPEYPHLIAKSGTLGAGLQYRSKLSGNVKLRLEYASVNYSASEVRHNVNYALSFKMMTHSVILDWHPFNGAFRTSAGMVFGQPELHASAYYDQNVSVGGKSVTGSQVIALFDTVQPSQALTVNQYTITGSEIIQYVSGVDPNQSVSHGAVTFSGRELGQAYADVRYPNYAPYLGIGWGNFGSDKGRLLYTIDLGVMYLGRPKVQLSLSGPVSALANQYDAAATQAYLAQQQQNLEDSLSKYRYYPVLSVGLRYMF